MPHDRLFLDALERDLKREKMGTEPTTHIAGEPARSFAYDPSKSLYEQFARAHGAREGEDELDAAVRRIVEQSGGGGGGAPSTSAGGSFHPRVPRGGLQARSASRGSGGAGSSASTSNSEVEESDADDPMTGDEGPSIRGVAPATGLFLPAPNQGSPNYKLRRKKGARAPSALRRGSEEAADERGRDAAGMGHHHHHRFASASRERGGGGGVPGPAHPSMRDEFNPHSLAEQARQAAALSAADMFIKQARGELLPGDGVVRAPRAPAGPVPEPVVS